MCMICTKKDDWLINQDSTLWICTLSDGTLVYQDDERPNIDPPQAWFRLKHYIENSDLSIVRMELNFRSHTEIVGDNAEAFFFAKGILGSLSTNSLTHQYVAGTVIDGKLTTTTWRVPELLSSYENEERKIKNVDPRCLIWN